MLFTARPKANSGASSANTTTTTNNHSSSNDDVTTLSSSPSTPSSLHHNHLTMNYANVHQSSSDGTFLSSSPTTTTINTTFSSSPSSSSSMLLDNAPSSPMSPLVDPSIARNQRAHHGRTGSFDLSTLSQQDAQKKGKETEHFLINFFLKKENLKASLLLEHLSRYNDHTNGFKGCWQFLCNKLYELELSDVEFYLPQLL